MSSTAIRLERTAGAGAAASIKDGDYAAAGGTVGSRAETLSHADAVLGVQGPDLELLSGTNPGAWIVAGLDPFGQRPRIDAYAAAGYEARHRITSLDDLPALLERL